jgi:hypothetical protein
MHLGHEWSLRKAMAVSTQIVPAAAARRFDDYFYADMPAR